MKIVFIEDCSQCRYRIPVMNWKEFKIKNFTCTTTKNTVKKPFEAENYIPDWCPLESVKEEDPEEDDGIA